MSSPPFASLLAGIALVLALPGAAMPAPRVRVDDSAGATVVREGGHELRIEWLAAAPRDWQTESGKDLLRSSFRDGMTTVKRTVLVQEGSQPWVLVHALADQPGALALRATLRARDGTQAIVEDRRQLAVAGGRAWVLPFEADVTPADGAIEVRGEGELLVVVAFSRPGRDAPPLAGLVARLGERHDPAGQPPDPGKIWRGALAAHLKAREDSP